MNALMQKNQFSQTKVEHFRRLMTIQQMIRAGNQARLHEGEKGDKTCELVQRQNLRNNQMWRVKKRLQKTTFLV